MPRIRDYIDVCRMVWRREPVVYDGQTVHDPAARRAGHRARQAAEADQPSRARRHPDLLGEPDGQAASPTRPGIADGWLPIFFDPEKFQRRVGRRPAGRARRARPVARPAADLGRRDGRDRRRVRRRRRRPRARPRPPDVPRCTSAGWAPADKNFYNTIPSATATSTRPPRSRTSTCRAARRRRPRPCRGSCSPSTNLVGPSRYVAERIAAYKEAGVTHLSGQPGRPRPGQDDRDPPRPARLTQSECRAERRSMATDPRPNTRTLRPCRGATTGRAPRRRRGGRGRRRPSATSAR